MDKPFFTPEPVVFSVMGGVKNLPPETEDAVRAGFDSGADVACVNVQLSGDKVVMVITPESLESVCGNGGAVAEYTAEELKKFDAAYMFRDEEGECSFRGKGYSFMTLRELLETFPDKKFNVTLLGKGEELVRAYAGTVKSCGAEDRVLTSSANGKNISLARRLLPGSATSFSLAGIFGVYALFRSGLLFFKTGFDADVLQTPEAIGVSYIANSGLIREMHKRSVRVYVWNVNDRQQYLRLTEAGADGFMSDDVPALKGFMVE